MPARILYVGQTVEIQCNNGATRFLPVQSANVEINSPVEDILSFGVLGSLGRFQTSVSTCKSDIKSYIPLITGTGTVSDPSQANLVNTAFISQLTGESLQGLVSTITVSPNGFSMSGILTSFGCDIAYGGFATADFSFAGVGQPYVAPSPTGTSYTPSTQMPTSFTPVISSHVSGQTVTGCANSLKFMLDIPTDTISCLGGNITGTQLQVAPSFVMVARPPFKTTLTIEGTAVDVPAVPSGNQYVVGYLGITLPNARVISHSFNNSVGAVGATYSYTLEDVFVSFADVAEAYTY